MRYLRKERTVMKYSKKEAIKEIQLREADLREKRYNREMPLLSVASVILTAMVAALLNLCRDELGVGITTNRNFGTMLLDSEIGVYVLLAVIAFMAGVVITVLCMRYHRKHPAYQDRRKK